MQFFLNKNDNTWHQEINAMDMYHFVEWSSLLPPGKTPLDTDGQATLTCEDNIASLYVGASLEQEPLK